jgi:hypothetical protein
MRLTSQEERNLSTESVKLNPLLGTHILGNLSLELFLGNPYLNILPRKSLLFTTHSGEIPSWNLHLESLL